MSSKVFIDCVVIISRQEFGGIMTDKNIEESKSAKGSFSAQKYALNLGDQMSALVEVTEKFKTVADNPMMFTQIFLGLKTALDNFNVLLIDLTKKLEEIDKRLAELETSAPRESQELTKTDQEILDYVMTQERVTAEDVQKKFSYSGKNAASARLHKLFTAGALQKAHSGKTVYYTAPKNNP